METVKIINVTVKNKIAKAAEGALYVCGNSDFVVAFEFDSEWDEHKVKTARFISNGEYTDVVFEGNECKIPVLSNTNTVHVGVFAGDIKTTTSAHIMAQKSILCGGGSPTAPEPDVYAQIMKVVNSAENKVDNLIADAEAGEFDGEKGDPGPAGPTGADGISPTVRVEDIDGGHRVTITDKDGPTAFEVMDGDAGKYELIETVILDEDSVFSRTEEPDGTPYAFKSVFVRAETTSTSLSGTYGYYHSGGYIIMRVWHDAISNANGGVKRRIDHVMQNSGYWTAEYVQWSSPVMNKDANYVMTTRVTGPITKIDWRQTLKAGSKIEIWGVRA